MDVNDTIYTKIGLVEEFPSTLYRTINTPSWVWVQYYQMLMEYILNDSLFCHLRIKPLENYRVYYKTSDAGVAVKNG